MQSEGPEVSLRQEVAPIKSLCNLKSYGETKELPNMRKDKSLLLGLVCAVFALLQTQSTNATDAAAEAGGTVDQVVVSRVLARSDAATLAVSKSLGTARAKVTPLRVGVLFESSI